MITREVGTDIHTLLYVKWLLTWCSDEESACQCKRHKEWNSIPGSGRSPWISNGNPFQYSCLENSMDKGAWQATVHGVATSQAQLSNLTHTSHTHIKQITNKDLLYSTGEGNGTPLQCSCLENPMDGRAWLAAVHAVARSRTRLSDFTSTFHFHAWET